MADLSQLDWPGNIRQLENAVYRAVVISEGDQLGLADFPLARATRSHGAAAQRAAVARPLTIRHDRTAHVSGSDIPIAPLPSRRRLRC